VVKPLLVKEFYTPLALACTVLSSFRVAPPAVPVEVIKHWLACVTAAPAL